MSIWLTAKVKEHDELFDDLRMRIRELGERIEDLEAMSGSIVCKKGNLEADARSFYVSPGSVPLIYTNAGTPAAHSKLDTPKKRKPGRPRKQK